VCVCDGRSRVWLCVCLVGLVCGSVCACL
jgi:hypothetical protein